MHISPQVKEHWNTIRYGYTDAHEVSTLHITEESVVIKHSTQKEICSNMLIKILKPLKIQSSETNF